MDQNTNTSSKQILRTAQIIHFALCFGVFLFAIVSNFITQKPIFDLSYDQNILIVVLPLLAIGAIVLSRYLFNMQLETIDRNIILIEKLRKYQTSLIVSLAINEGIALFAIVFFLSSSNYLFLIVGMVLLINMILFRPSREKIETRLHLSESQKREFI